MTQDEIKVLEQESTDLVTQAKSYEIQSQEQYVAANDFLAKTVKSLQKKISEFFDPHVQRAHEAHKALTTDRKRHLDPIAQAEKIVKEKILTYHQAQERLRFEEQRKREEEAKREETRKRKEKEEQERAWREKEEAAKKEAERLAAEGNAEEARKAELAAQKAAQKAEERAEEAENVHVDVTVVAPKTEKVAGVSIKENWDFEIHNEAMLINSALNEPMLAHIVTINEKELRKLVKAYKGKLKLAGLKVFNKGSVAA